MERGWGGLEICQMFTDSVVVKITDLLFIFRDVVCAGGRCWAVGIIIAQHLILKLNLTKKLNFQLWFQCYSETAILASS